MDLTAGNLDSFEGKNIGVFKDNIVEDVLNEWESKYGLHTKHINVSTNTEIMDKLSKHEIDCFVSVEEPPLGRIGYFTAYKYWRDRNLFRYKSRTSGYQRSTG